MQGQAQGQGSRERIRKRGSYDYLRWSRGWGRVPGCSRGWEETGCLQQPPRAGAALRPSAGEPGLQCAQHLVMGPAYDQHRKELFPTKHVLREKKKNLHLSLTRPVPAHLFTLSLNFLVFSGSLSSLGLQ